MSSKNNTIFCRIRSILILLCVMWKSEIVWFFFFFLWISLKVKSYCTDRKQQNVSHITYRFYQCMFYYGKLVYKIFFHCSDPKTDKNSILWTNFKTFFGVERRIIWEITVLISLYTLQLCECFHMKFIFFAVPGYLTLMKNQRFLDTKWKMGFSNDIQGYQISDFC